MIVRSPRAGRWSRVFERFAPGRYVLVEPIGVAVHDWARPQPGEATLFDHPAIERMTCAQPGTLATIYGWLAAVLCWRGIAGGVTFAGAALLIAGGLACWTLLEYVMHRFTFHFTPRTRRQVFFAYLFHGVHHAFPDDGRRWMMPLVTSLPVAAVLTTLSWLAFGAAGGPFMSGIVLGYLAYDLLHYAFHRGPLRSRFGNYLRKRHLAHHYGVPERNFGVSSPIWDVIFRTGR
jgi:sterol desaturase/sphingolipid hydroxylase (fatty acid hydroxylase superfamily)